MTELPVVTLETVGLGQGNRAEKTIPLLLTLLKVERGGFGSLDQFPRRELWQTLRELWITRPPTVFLGTHDLREGTCLASRIRVMSARLGRAVIGSSRPFARPGA
ncbi:MAG: hypothetical protein AAGI03_01720 [Pseudomonadota bacterium]